MRLARSQCALAVRQLLRDRRCLPAAWHQGSGVFYAGYVVFQIPSNLMLARLGAKLWLPCITAAWGVVAMCGALIKGGSRCECWVLWWCCCSAAGGGSQLAS
jgi:ACS family tartrate transporter-like MFS transporter